MKLNRKLWTAALAVAMTTPSAMAAQDTAGMHYTSAAEGFYASIRLRYVSNGGDKDGGANLENSSSRIGVRGTNDLGGGLEGFYQYEMLVNTDQGEGVSTRLGHVGLRGDFGSVVAGAFWPDTYNFVYGSTDVANRSSGNFTGGFGQYRTSKSLQYTTPDLNGFQGAILIKADSSSDGEGAVTSDTAATDDDTRTEDQITNTGDIETVTLRVKGQDAKKGNKDDNDIDHWSLAAKYEIAGFSMGASYSNSPDAMVGELGEDGKKRAKAGAIYFANLRAAASTVYANSLDGASGPSRTRAQYLNDIVEVAHDKEDLTSWAVKLGYSQDNWYVNGWYGEINHGDGRIRTRIEVPDSAGGDAHVESIVFRPLQDTEVFSLAGGVSVDKISVYAVHENRENQYSEDDSYTTLGVQYTLGSNSWTWVEYAGRDHDSSDSEDDDFSIGLGHSF